MSYRVFVIHMRRGYEDRKRHIDTHLPSRGIEKFEFICDGDSGDLSEQEKDRLFYGEIRQNEAAMSCAFKHLQAYKRILEDSLPYALILEDDAILPTGFSEKLSSYIPSTPQEEPFVASLEETNTRVPIFLRKKGKVLYQANDLQTLGGYVINAAAAEILVEALEQDRSFYPIDSMLTLFCREKGISMYRAEPPLVRQGSKNGKFHSVLSNRAKSSRLGAIRWHITKWYHAVIVSNLNPKRIRYFSRPRL